MNKRDIKKLIDISNHLFVETSQYSKSLGLLIDSMDRDRASMRFIIRDDLTGSDRTRNLHGGVIAAALDVTGSLVVFSNLVYRMKTGSIEERIKRVTRLNTIDLRIDYIRPGAGANFIATGDILRTGSTVAVSRMELRNENDRLLAVGTGSYILSLAS